MTTQSTKALCYEGEELGMVGWPLDDYFLLGGVDPGFRCDNTALRRGYIGTWEINNGRLYLIGLKGRLKDGGEGT